MLVQDDTVNDRLQSQLRDQLSDIANAETVDQLTQATKTSFGLDTGDDQIRQSFFSSLKQALMMMPNRPAVELTPSCSSTENSWQTPEFWESWMQVLPSACCRRVLLADKSTEPQSINQGGSTLRRCDPLCVLADVLLQEQLRKQVDSEKPGPSSMLCRKSGLHSKSGSPNLRNQLKTGSCSHGSRTA